MTDLVRAAKKVVVEHLGVKAEESVVIITDEQRRPIGLAIFDAARSVGAEAVLIEIIERQTHGTEPPPAVAKAMSEADVIVAPTTKSLSHTDARKNATTRGARVASMPLVTVEMMARALNADSGRLKSLGTAYAKALTEAQMARITSPGGTDCILDLSSRTAIPDDGDLSKPSAFGNLPAGEAFIAPVEGKASGVIVFDGSLSPDGKTDTPVRVTVEAGRIVKVEGGPAPGFLELPEKYGDEAWEVAELGVGTNEMAIITGNTLEDEKVASTIHVAFGNNGTIGGITHVASHHDGVVRDASLELDGRMVLEAGRLLLEN